jgi:hypothetical protein
VHPHTSVHHLNPVRRVMMVFIRRKDLYYSELHFCTCTRSTVDTRQTLQYYSASQLQTSTSQKTAEPPATAANQNCRHRSAQEASEVSVPCHIPKHVAQAAKFSTPLITPNSLLHNASLSTQHLPQVHAWPEFPRRTVPVILPPLVTSSACYAATAEGPVLPEACGCSCHPACRQRRC